MTRKLIALLNKDKERVITFLLPFHCLNSLFFLSPLIFFLIEKKAQRWKLNPKCYKYELFRMESKPEEVMKSRDKISSVLGHFLDLASFFPYCLYLWSLAKMN